MTEAKQISSAYPTHAFPNLMEHAHQEIAIAFGDDAVALAESASADTVDDPAERWDLAVIRDVLQLLQVIDGKGHSGLSWNTVVSMFTRLALREPLTPLTGTDDEWVDVSHVQGDPPGTIEQNKRCSRVFRSNRDNSTARDVDGRRVIFDDDENNAVTEAKPIQFPYVPSTETVYRSKWD